jgi:hypothetical protein
MDWGLPGIEHMLIKEGAAPYATASKQFFNIYLVFLVFNLKAF